jgi:hypothetical protein
MILASIVTHCRTGCATIFGIWLVLGNRPVSRVRYLRTVTRPRAREKPPVLEMPGGGINLEIDRIIFDSIVIHRRTGLQQRLGILVGFGNRPDVQWRVPHLARSSYLFATYRPK